MLVEFKFTIQMDRLRVTDKGGDRVAKVSVNVEAVRMIRRNRPPMEMISLTDKFVYGMVHPWSMEVRPYLWGLQRTMYKEEVLEEYDKAFHVKFRVRGIRGREKSA